MKTPLLLLALAVTAACAQRTARSAQDPNPDGSAIILRGTDLSGTLLDAMRVRVPTMTVSTQGAPCPSIMFRGVKSIRNQGNPSIYIDGTLVGDTCILQQISSSDVDRVEIYPHGYVSRPGIRHNSFGVIVVERVRH